MTTTHKELLGTQLKRVPAAIRPTIETVRQLVQTVAPRAVEVGYRSQRPKSPRALWKLARYTVEGRNVVGIGTFPTYALLFFYKGRDLEDLTGALEGTGKAMRFLRLYSPADARRVEVRRIVRKALDRAALST